MNIQSASSLISQAVDDYSASCRNFLNADVDNHLRKNPPLCARFARTISRDGEEKPRSHRYDLTSSSPSSHFNFLTIVNFFIFLFLPPLLIWIRLRVYSQHGTIRSLIVKIKIRQRIQSRSQKSISRYLNKCLLFIFLRIISLIMLNPSLFEGCTSLRTGPVVKLASVKGESGESWRVLSRGRARAAKLFMNRES